MLPAWCMGRYMDVHVMTCTYNNTCTQAAIVRAMLPRDESDEHSAVLELRAGTCMYLSATACSIHLPIMLIMYIAVGGVESSLFTAEVFTMYQK